jgi:hypothetical protein
MSLGLLSWNTKGYKAEIKGNQVCTGRGGTQCRIALGVWRVGSHWSGTCKQTWASVEWLSR